MTTKTSRKKNRKVIDSQGNEYMLTGKIGEGGQGIVCSTDKSNIVVKVCNSKNKQVKQQWQQQLDWCLRQNLTDLNLALPKIAIVKPAVGYVMEFMDDLVPLEQVLQQSLDGFLESESAEQYLDTGGVERRIRLLLNLADTLAELHSRGYAYGDLSPANIFVSKQSPNAQVWLIDCDNLCFNEREGVTHFYTPGYGAPEVVRGEQNVNCLTDAWAFAVMAFQLFTHQHPFIGEIVEHGDVDMDSQAFEGRLPWIYQDEDDSNAACGALDMDLVCNQALMSLFRQCFEQGKDLPLKRPSLALWRSTLQAAIDQVLHCDNCGHSFFYDADKKHQICPFCESELTPDKFMVFEQILKVEGADEDKGEEKGKSEALFATGEIRVLNVDCQLSFNAAPYNTELWAQSNEVLKIKWHNNKLELVPNHGGSFLIAKGQQSAEFDHKKQIPANKKSDLPYQVTCWQPELLEDEQHKQLLQRYQWRFTWGHKS